MDLGLRDRVAIVTAALDSLAAPGLHATDRVLERGTTGRTGEPADFGKVVAFLCSEPAGFVNGSALGVDGGAVTGLL
jgi:3-oxoacyl-[acyl-carrier protein] reductase